MLRAFGEVLVELSDFALRKAAPASVGQGNAVSSAGTSEDEAPAFHDHLAKASVNAQELASAPVATPAPDRTPAPVPSPPKAQPDRSNMGHHHGFVATVDLACYLRPVRALDTVIGLVPYGAKVAVHVYQGRWAKIERNGAVAWVERDGLSSEREAVFPELEDGVVYESTHPLTVTIRAIIKDEFAAADLLLPLLDIEYVTYRLYEAGRTIAWPDIRPRLSGRWHTILRGVKGIHMGVRPTTGAVMEWSTDAGEGHLALVEAVHPDESIELATVGERVDGRFSRRKLPKSQWQELRPTFIELS